MSERNPSGNLSSTRLFAALVGLAMIVLMVYAMFSTQSGPYSSQYFIEQQSPAKQITTFRDNMRKNVHQGLVEIL